jgi:predicted component of type VI protein secretion system
MSDFVVGIEDHYAWANLLSVAADGADVQLLDRRRVVLLDPGLPASPYHGDTIGMLPRDAERVVHEVRRSAAQRATSALTTLIADLSPARCRGIAIRTPPLTRLPDTVAEAHADAWIRNRADGMIYHLALTDAARALGLAVFCFDKASVVALAAAAGGSTAQAFEQRLQQLGKSLGPPWRKGHVWACAGAILAQESAHAGRSH